MFRSASVVASFTSPLNGAVTRSLARTRPKYAASICSAITKASRPSGVRLHAFDVTREKLDAELPLQFIDTAFDRAVGDRESLGS